jgi:hypothetical protein
LELSLQALFSLILAIFNENNAQPIVLFLKSKKVEKRAFGKNSHLVYSKSRGY